MVDRVPLFVLDQAQQVGELHRHHPSALEQQLDAAHEVVDVGHVRQHVVGHHEVGRRRGGQRARGGRPEELDQRWHIALARYGGDIGGRLHPEHGDARGAEVLQ